MAFWGPEKAKIGFHNTMFLVISTDMVHLMVQMYSYCRVLHFHVNSHA